MSKKLTFIEKFENDLKALTKFLVGEPKPKKIIKAKKKAKSEWVDLNQKIKEKHTKEK